jgi:group II intron reverse transcriptase/maturase
MDVAALRRAYHKQRKFAAVGVDKVNKEIYGQQLETNLEDLHERLKNKRYRHQPILRVHIPKEQGKKKRPIGISAFEDKVVQEALRAVMEAVYEQDFSDCSYGFRPGRSAHDAIRALDRVVSRGEVNWILEADIKSFFDSMDRPMLQEMIQRRIPDGSIKRLVGKCLHVGILDGLKFTRPDQGTAQGSVLSPLLGNVYLHDALDTWFEQAVKPRLRGKAHLIRHADDFVIGFENHEEAQQVLKLLGERLEQFNLSLHPDKTRIIDFRRPPLNQKGGKEPGTFDLLGFTIYWRRNRKNRWVMTCKTRRVRLRRAMQNVYDWCRRHRHLPVAVQHATLVRKIRGHYNYFGVNGNIRSLIKLDQYAKHAWHKWLNRRSQKSRLTWERFYDLCRDFPFPKPRITVRIWGT